MTKKISKEAVLLIGGLFLGILGWVLYELIVDIMKLLLIKFGVENEILV